MKKQSHIPLFIVLLSFIPLSAARHHDEDTCSMQLHISKISDADSNRDKKKSKDPAPFSFKKFALPLVTVASSLAFNSTAAFLLFHYRNLLFYYKADFNRSVFNKNNAIIFETVSLKYIVGLIALGKLALNLSPIVAKGVINVMHEGQKSNDKISATQCLWDGLRNPYFASLALSLIAKDYLLDPQKTLYVGSIALLINTLCRTIESSEQRKNTLGLEVNKIHQPIKKFILSYLLHLLAPSEFIKFNRFCEKDSSENNSLPQ